MCACVCVLGGGEGGITESHRVHISSYAIMTVNSYTMEFDGQATAAAVQTRGGHSHRHHVQRCNCGQNAVKWSRYFLGLVKRSSSVLGTTNGDQWLNLCTCAVGRWSTGQGQNSPWSSGQGYFSMVKNLDCSCTSGHSAYGSDPP